MCGFCFSCCSLLNCNLDAWHPHLPKAQGCWADLRVAMHARDSAGPQWPSHPLLRDMKGGTASPGLTQT